ncbi:MAG: pitrilysin family protein [Bacteroidales bacterium]
MSNGLRLIIHEDHTTPLVSCNVVYNIGSRDENPNKTGMAHLFEHYMFCGSKNIADYDLHLQKIGAINNAYTTQDITHYYITLPANNLETALWLESDRMLELAFLEDQLAIQKNVVIEEFKENFLNRPYGDMWLCFNDFVYERHPYKWLPIGKEISHIEKVTMSDMKEFFSRYYVPNNAVLTVAGNVKREEVISLVEKWFGDIPAGKTVTKNFPMEQENNQARLMEIYREVPSDMLMKGWKMGGRLSPDFYTYDLISDLFGSGQSSYLYQNLVTENQIFTDISAYVTATLDPGVFIVGGRPAEGVTIEEADRILSEYLFNFNFDLHLEKELQKVKNRVESILLGNEIKIEDRASLLGVSECFSCVEDFENERDRYFAVTTDQIETLVKSLLVPNKANTLYYRAK